jgi:hypothetical protein
MSSDQTKIKINKRIKLETFIHEMQKKTKQILCLLNNNEILILDIDQISNGMWKKYKDDDSDCYHYLDEDNNEHIKIFSEEANTKLGSVPPSVISRVFIQKDKEDLSEVTKSTTFTNKFEKFMNHPSIQNPIPYVTYQPQPTPPPNPYIYNNSSNSKNKKEAQKILNMQKFNQIQSNFTTTSSMQPNSYNQQQYNQTPYLSFNIPQQNIYQMRNSNNTFQQPQLSMQQPQLSLQQPQLSLQQPQLSMQQPQLSLQQPQLSMQQPQLSMQQPQLSLQQNVLNNGYQQESVSAIRNVNDNNYYQHNPYIPFYNGVKPLTNKSKGNVSNEKPQKIESKYMA